MQNLRQLSACLGLFEGDGKRSLDRKKCPKVGGCDFLFLIVLHPFDYLYRYCLSRVHIIANWLKIKAVVNIGMSQ
ncbi:hypothetical protein GCM10009133_19550 [Cocleimonas flava]